MKTFPIITLVLCTASLALPELPEATLAKLYWNANAIAQGQYGSLVTGHWLHVGSDHLLWNVSALAVLGSLIELHSRRLLVLSLAIGTVAVDIALASPLAELSRYCGLSGVLNTLMGVVLYLQWRHSRSFVPIVIALLWLAKTVIEAGSGQGIVSNTTWPPFALAHLAGMLATPLVFMINRYIANAIGHDKRNNKHEHLVPGK